MGILVTQFGATENNPRRIVLPMPFGEDVYIFLLNIYVGMGFLGHTLGICSV